MHDRAARRPERRCARLGKNREDSGFLVMCAETVVIVAALKKAVTGLPARTCAARCAMQSFLRAQYVCSMPAATHHSASERPSMAR